MPKPMLPERRRLAACLLAVCAGGCALVGGLSDQKPDKPTAPDRAQPDVGAIVPVLEMMSVLPQSDPVRQAEVFQSVKEAAELTPTTANKLKFALALATPGHIGSDAVAAQRQLSELLARPETLLPMERLLAMIELKDVDQRLVLQSETRNLRDEAMHDAHDKLLAANRRLSAEADENARLRKALDEARAKLEAVTHIEGSINDRGTIGSAKP